jgi:hypothetical protein
MTSKHAETTWPGWATWAVVAVVLPRLLTIPPTNNEI